MRKFVELDENGRICITADTGSGESFEFPDDFDFKNQSMYEIIGGEIRECADVAIARANASISELQNTLSGTDGLVLTAFEYLLSSKSLSDFLARLLKIASENKAVINERAAIREQIQNIRDTIENT